VGTRRDPYQSAAVQHITRNVLARMANQSAPSPILFYRADTVTEGDWRPRYGVEGSVLPGESTNLPLYASVAANGANTTTFLSSSTNRNALQHSNSTNRFLAGWSSSTSFILDVNLLDNSNHLAALYFWDWNRAGRSQLVEVLDPAGNLLDRRTVTGF